MIRRGVGMTSGGAEIASTAGTSPINGVTPVSTVHEFSKTEVLPQGEKQATMQTVSPDRRQHSR